MKHSACLKDLHSKWSEKRFAEANFNMYALAADYGIKDKVDLPQENQPYTNWTSPGLVFSPGVREIKDAQVWMRRLGDKLQLSPDTVTRAECEFFTNLPMGIDYSQNDRPNPSEQEWMKSRGEYYERYLKELDKISHLDYGMEGQDTGPYRIRHGHREGCQRSHGLGQCAVGATWR